MGERTVVFVSPSWRGVKGAVSFPAVAESSFTTEEGECATDDRDNADASLMMHFLLRSISQPGQYVVYGCNG